ncbi:MAG: SBBP repeat-containing protein, partial [Candidatus Acidiferrales bacterium]
AYVAGTANSTDFPVTDGAFQKNNNDAPLEESTAFVAKLNATGSALVYSTYVGGSGTAMAGEPTVFGDEANAIAIDGDGDAYVAGATYSADFPITSLAFQTTNKGFSGSTRLFLLRSSTRPVRGWFSRPSWAGRGVTSRRASRWMVREKSF